MKNILASVLLLSSFSLSNDYLESAKFNGESIGIESRLENIERIIVSGKFSYERKIPLK